MVRITFIQPDGAEQTVDAPLDMTLMQAARDNDIAGIAADCGGALACGTCHIHVEAEWTATVGPPAPDEAMMIECAEAPRENSRLSCQVALRAALDGLRVRIPAESA